MASTRPEETTETEQPAPRTWKRKELIGATLVGALTPCLLWLGLLDETYLGLLFMMFIIPPMWLLAALLMVLAWALLLVPLSRLGVARTKAVAFVALLALLFLGLCAVVDLFLNEPLTVGSWSVISAPSAWVTRTVVMCLAGALACALVVTQDHGLPGFVTVGAAFLLLCLATPLFSTLDYRATVERTFDQHEHGVAVAGPQWQPHSLDLEHANGLSMLYTHNDRTMRVESGHPDSAETIQECDSCEQRGEVTVRHDSDGLVQEAYLRLEDEAAVLISPYPENSDEEIVLAFAQELDLASPQERSELRDTLKANPDAPR